MNKPLFWLYINKETKIKEIVEKRSRIETPNYEEIPLYTHPVKEQEPDLYSEDGFPLWTSPQFKELTDEEIGQIFADNLTFMIRTKEDANSLIDCAKAILRKAQEK